MTKRLGEVTASRQTRKNRPSKAYSSVSLHRQSPRGPALYLLVMSKTDKAASALYSGIGSSMRGTQLRGADDSATVTELCRGVSGNAASLPTTDAGPRDSRCQPGVRARHHDDPVRPCSVGTFSRHFPTIQETRRQAASATLATHSSASCATAWPMPCHCSATISETPRVASSRRYGTRSIRLS